MVTQHTRAETERAVRRRLGETPLRWEAMAVVANIYRAAAVIRQHVENSVLREARLTWTGFVVLWVVWIWDELETGHAAAEAGISKGTLTGVVNTLAARGLVERHAHSTDGRRVVLRLTDEGEELMRRLFPEFNAEEAFVTERLAASECRQLADSLRRVVTHVETDGARRRQQVATWSDPPPRPGGRRQHAS